MDGTVFFAAAGILAAVLIALETGSRLMQRKAPGLEYNDVLVIDKRISVKGNEPHYFITFLRKDGVKREFEVDSERYSQIEEGEEGELCLEDEIF